MSYESIALEKSKYVNEMQHEGLKSLLVDLAESATVQDLTPEVFIDEVVEKATKVMDIVMKMLTDSHQYKEGNPRNWVDILIVVAHLYFLYWNKEHPITSLYLPREIVLQRIGEETSYKDCEFNILIALFDAFECSRGCRTEVMKCQPAPNSPQQVLGDAIWYVENFS